MKIDNLNPLQLQALTDFVEKVRTHQNQLILVVHEHWEYMMISMVERSHPGKHLDYYVGRINRLLDIGEITLDQRGGQTFPCEIMAVNKLGEAKIEPVTLFPNSVLVKAILGLPIREDPELSQSAKIYWWYGSLATDPFLYVHHKEVGETIGALLDYEEKGAEKVGYVAGAS